MSRPIDLLLALALLAGPASARSESIPLETSLQPAGTVSFRLQTERGWQNGAGQPSEKLTLLSIPDFGAVVVQQTASQVGLSWQWHAVAGAPGFRPLMPELPGPEEYFLQFTWDATAGRCDFYVNGMAMRDTAVPFEPWQFEKAPKEILVHEGPFRIRDLQVQSRFLPPEAARQAVPTKLLRHRAEVFGAEEKPPALDVEKRLGRVLYETRLASPEQVAGWVMEGPGRIDFEPGWMQMRSTRPDAGKGTNGHVVFWCPEDFPACFVAEWEIQLIEETGLTIVFFAAKGAEGEDVFDPALPDRDGTFKHYTHGSVNSYHISYYANTPGYPGRATANLRKNNRFYLAASGPVAIGPGDPNVHRLRLVKDGPHLQFVADDRVVIDYTDPGSERFGPVYGGGKIALRQMQWTVARYRNFRVTELLPASETR